MKLIHCSFLETAAVQPSAACQACAPVLHNQLPPAPPNCKTPDGEKGIAECFPPNSAAKLCAWAKQECKGPTVTSRKLSVLATKSSCSFANERALCVMETHNSAVS